MDKKKKQGRQIKLREEKCFNLAGQKWLKHSSPHEGSFCFYWKNTVFTEVNIHFYFIFFLSILFVICFPFLYLFIIFPFFFVYFPVIFFYFYYWLIILCNFCIYSKYFVNFQLYLHWWFQSAVFEFLLFFFSYLLIWLFLVLLNYFPVHVFLLFLLNYIFISWISFKHF